MDLDEDLFADGSGPAVNQGRGRFQPRAKLRARTETVASVSSSVPSNSKKNAITESSSSLETSQPVQPANNGDSSLTTPIASSGLILAVPEMKEPMENNEDSLLRSPTLDDNLKSQVVNPSSEAVAMRDDVGSGDVLPMKVGVLTTEADSAEFDLDPFAYNNPGCAAGNVRAGGKYQPKDKPQPRIEMSPSSTILPDDGKQKDMTRTCTRSDSGQLVQPTDVTDKDYRSMDDVGLSLATSELVGIEEQLEENEGSAHAMLSEVAVSDGCGDLHLSFAKPGDMFSGLESVNDFPSQSTHGTDNPAPIDYDKKDKSQNVSIQGQSSLNTSAPSVSDVSHADISADLFIDQDPVTCREACIFNSDVVFPIDDGRLETEVQQPRACADLETLDFVSEATFASGWRAGKYKPKPKVRTEKEKPNSSMPHTDAVESVLLPPTAQFVSSETECMSEGSVPVFPPDYMLDYSTVDLGDIIPPDSMTSEFPTNEELTNLAETSHADATSSGDVQPEDVFGMTENMNFIGRKRKASTVSNLPQRSNEHSLAGEEIKGGKSSRQLRKRVAAPELVDEPDDNGNFNVEPPSSSVDEDEANIDGCRVESKSQKKRAPRKSKNPMAENEKPVQKHKKSNKASDQLNKEAPKKFCHSTRRNKRRVSKELLETPEDEIDHRKVPLKDLILLAEYRERLASKEAKTSTTPMTNQSTENPFHGEDYLNEEETFASEQGSGYINDEATRRVQSSSLYFNYQSYMKKTPTVRWSKQDTELFYEAVRQFGTDLSMIQQLFPGRTRQQIKLKYKKEERKQPLRLTEALTNRAKDHSHFQKVIEQLQQVAAQAGGDTNGDDPTDITGEEVEELATEMNDEAEKVDQDEDEEAGVAEVHSPLKADESDEDDDFWSSYKSEF